MTTEQSIPTEQGMYRYIMYQYVTTCIGALTIILNIMEIAYIRFSRNSRLNPIGIVYITNLALSDIFVGLIMILLKVMHIFMNTSLKGNLVAAEIYNFIRFCLIRFSLLLSVFNLIALTLDRVCAVHNPFKQQRRRRSVSVKICVAIWMTSLVLMSVFYGVLRLYFEDEMERYKDVILPAVTYPATMLFVVSYWSIFDVIKKRSKIISKNRLKIKDNRKTDKMTKRNVTRDEVKFVRLSVKTVSVFVLCWMPLSTISFIKLFRNNYGAQELEPTFFTLAVANSIITPFVYFPHLWKTIKATLEQLTATNVDKIKRKDPNILHMKQSGYGKPVSVSSVLSTPNLNIHHIKVTKARQLDDITSMEY